MGSDKVILVTGVDGFWGAKTAKRLCLERGFNVIGLAKKPPFLDIEGLDYVDVGLDNPLLAEFLRSEDVSTICHMAFGDLCSVNDAKRASIASGAKRILEVGRQAGVDQIVIRSSTTVYGAHPDNPAVLTESMPLRGSQNSKYSRYWLETESFVNEARQADSQMSIAVLRFANIVGSKVNTPFTRFLNQKSPRVLLGFDPLVQIIHDKDVIEAVAFAALQNVSGDFNIAPHGVMPLSRIMRILRKIPHPIFHRLVDMNTRFAGRAKCPRKEQASIEWDYLRYSFVADTAKMQTIMGFLPSIEPVDALLESAGRKSFDSVPAEHETVPDDVSHVRELMRKRKQERTGGIR